MNKPIIPETVFRYRSPTKFAFAELATRAVWMADVADFNDPFEFKFNVSDFPDTPENRRFAAKIIEEGGELAFALTDESDQAVAAEAADVLYHMLVGLSARGVSMADVAAVLETREGMSGLEEKAGREKT